MKVTLTNDPSTTGLLLGPVSGERTAGSEPATVRPAKIIPAKPAFSDVDLIAQIKAAYPKMTDAEVEEQLRMFW